MNNSDPVHYCFEIWVSSRRPFPSGIWLKFFMRWIKGSPRPMMNFALGKQIQHSINAVEEARVCAMWTREFSVQPIDKGDTHRKAKAISSFLVAPVRVIFKSPSMGRKVQWILRARVRAEKTILIWIYQSLSVTLYVDWRGSGRWIGVPAGKMKTVTMGT